MSDLVCARLLRSFSFFSFFLTTSHTEDTGGAGSSNADICKQHQEMIIDRSVGGPWLSVALRANSNPFWAIMKRNLSNLTVWSDRGLTGVCACWRQSKARCAERHTAAAIQTK